jgi:hypothetical protein
VLLAVCAVGVPRAWADGDPASDVLLAQNAFYPYQPPVPPKLEATLNNLLAASARARMPLKVAIISSPEELGLVPKYFGHPQDYARFLDREISFNGPQPLLVVMPAGFGLAAAGPASALTHIPLDAAQRTYGLTRAAILATVALAHANGHPLSASASLPATPTAATPAHHGVSTVLLFGLPLLLLVLAGLAALRRHRSRPPGDEPFAQR